MRLPVIFAALALASCTHTRPGVEVRTVEVVKEVAVPCIDKGQIPIQPAPVGKLPDDARQAADLLGDKVIELRGAFRKSIALMLACVREQH